uniref:Bromo domain-containing protein n=1 Tax=Tetradesmus obliquus TaxID=3088 RepID=A0A383VNB0_TETOB|eukprot:jgi/Sobl393_1/11600/SZX67018.1
MAANGGSRKRKVQLRLDDGSLLGSVETLLGNGGSGTVLLDFEAACRTGRASKAELERLDKLISAFQARVNGFHALPRGELKARNPYTQDVSRAIKRQRSLANGEVPVFASPDQAATGDFLGKCVEVLNRVYACCATIPPIFNWSAKDVFYKPVSETFPTIAADYYSRIPQPMTFQMIEQRIRGGVYQNAQQFADDMRLLVSNCKMYNPTPTDPVRLAVLRLGEVFEQQWIASGLCAEAQRAKRANAGIAAPKFEPEEYDGMAGGPKPHRSGGDKRPPEGGLGRLQSHEVSSYREEEVEQHAIPEDVLQEVAGQLQELGQENLQVALGKFNEGVVSYDEEGEVELDLERVDYASLMEVDAYIRQLLGLPPREPQPPPRAAAAAAPADTAEPSEGNGRRNRGTVQAEADDDDEYYGEEDESDDDD